MPNRKYSARWPWIFIVATILALAQQGRHGLPDLSIVAAPETNSTVSIVDFTVQVIIDDFRGLHLVVDGVNYSLYDGMMLNLGFNNYSALGENDTIVRDMSDQSPNGTPLHGLGWQPDRGYGGTGGFNFSGNSTRDNDTWYVREIRLDGWPQLTNESINWTASLRFYAFGYSHTADAEAIINVYGDWDGFLRHYNSGSTIYTVRNLSNANASCCDDNVAASIAGTLKKWHHVVMRRGPGNASNYSNFSIFMDGELITQKPVHSKDGVIRWSRAFGLQIGGLQHAVNAQSQGLAFNGSIDDVVFVNRTMTDDEIVHASRSTFIRTTPNIWTYRYLADSISDGTHSYQVCATSPDGDTCTPQITMTIRAEADIMVNYASQIGVIGEMLGSITRFYVSNQTINLVYENGSATKSNVTWHSEKMASAGLRMLRQDNTGAALVDRLPNADFEAWNWTKSPTHNITYANSKNFGANAWRASVQNTPGATTTFSRITGSSGRQDDFALLITNKLTNPDDPPGFGDGVAFAYQDFLVTAGHTYALEGDYYSDGTTTSNTFYLQDGTSGSTLCTITPTTPGPAWTYGSCTTPLTTNTSVRIVLRAPPQTSMAYDAIKIYEDGIPYYPAPDITRFIDVNQWAASHNATALWIIDSFPTPWANVTDECLYEVSYCMPNDLNLYKEQLVSWIRKITKNGTLNRHVAFEFTNEPDGRMWLPNISRSNQSAKIVQWLRIYNATYDAIKAYDPNILVGGPATGVPGYASEFTPWWPAIIANANDATGLKFDFLSGHPYSDTTPLPAMAADAYARIQAECATQGVTCDRIFFSEFNTHDPVKLANQSDWMYANWAATYFWIANTAPQILTVLPYQWSENYYYAQDGSVTRNPDQSTRYSEYPHKFHMVQEPQLVQGSDQGQGDVTGVYNATFEFNRHFPLGTQTYGVSSADPDLYLVAGRAVDEHYLVGIANVGTRNKTVTLGLTQPPGYTGILSLIDQKTGTNITATNNRVMVYLVSNSVHWYEAVPTVRSSQATDGTTPPSTCVSQWTCDAWSACTNHLQTRDCTDANACMSPNPPFSESLSQACPKDAPVTPTDVRAASWLIGSLIGLGLLLELRRRRR